MKTPRRLLVPSLAVSLTILLASCGDRSTGPVDPAVAAVAAAGFAPASAIAAAHNPAFPRAYFLPPLVPQAAFDGTFDPTLLDHLAVEICRANDAGCAGDPIRMFSAGQGATYIRLDVGDEHYIVNWDVRGTGILPGDYRLNLRLGTVVIAGLKLRLATKPQDLRNLPADVVGVHIGRTLAVKFRIEQSEDAALSMTLTPASAIALIGGTQQLTATVFNSDGTPRPGEAIMWSSSDDAIATVDADGLVTGHAIGSATITAAAAGLSATSELEVRAPDLRVTALTAPTAVTLGDSIAVEAVVANTGSADAAATKIRFRVLDAETDAEVAVVLLDQPAIAAGATAAASTFFTPAATWPRSLAIEAMTDAEATVTESNETNNTALSADIAFTAPDLTVAVTSSATSVVAGSTFDIAAVVSNPGTSGAAAAKLQVRVLNAATNAELAAYTLDQEAVAAGASTTVTQTIGSVLAWPSSIIVEVATDAEGAVTEWDEANNSARTGTIAVTVPEALDFVMKSVTFSTASVGLRCALGMTAVVRNDGNGAAPAANLRFSLLNSLGAAFASVIVAQPALAAGAEATVSATFTAAADWPSQVSGLAEADVSNGVAESSETNNTAASTVAVQASVVVPAGFHKIWICGDNTNWSLGSNWEPSGAPTAGQNVYIPAGVTQYPVLLEPRPVNDLTIEDGASVNIVDQALTATGNVVSGLMLGTTGHLNLTGNFKTLRGTVPTVDIHAAISLSGHTMAKSVIVNAGRSLAIGAFTLHASEDFFISPTNSAATHLAMNDPAGRLDVRHFTIGGFSSLTAGVIHVRGHLTQNGAINALTPAGTKFIFDGTGPQTIYFSHLLTSYLRDVEIRGPAVDVATNVAIAGQLDVAAGGGISQSGGEMYYTSRVPDEVSSGGYRVRMSRMHGSVVMVRDVTLGSTAANFAVSAGFSLTIGEHTLNMAGDFFVDPTNNATKHVVMTDAAGRLKVKSMTVGGATLLDAGAIHVSGHLTQNGAINALTPAGTKFIFDGAGAQTIYFSHLLTSWLRDVEIRGNVDVLTNAAIAGQLDVVGGGVMTQSGGNTYYTTRVPAESNAGGYRVPTSRVHGGVVMVRDVTLGSPVANIVVSAGFSATIGEHTLDIAGNLTVDPSNNTTKHVVMTHADGRVRAKHLTVGGATQLDAGAIHVRGNFTQNGAVNAMTPAGTKVIFDGAGPQTIYFSHLLTSWLRDVEIRGPAVDVITNAAVAGQLDVAPGGVITQSAGNVYYTSRVPDEVTAGSYRVPTSRMHGSVVMVRNVTLAAPNASIAVSAGHGLDMAGFQLTVGGNFTVDATNSASDHVLMTSGDPRLEVRGHMTVGGRTRLDAGSIVLRGGFTQSGAINSMIPNGTKVVFDGPARQDVYFSHLLTSWLDDVEVRTTPAAGGVRFITNLAIRGQLTAMQGSLVTQSDGAAYYVNRVPDELSPAAYQVPMSLIAGPAQMDHDVTLGSAVAGIAVTPGFSLTIGEHTLDMAGDFGVQASNNTTKHVVMTNPAGRLLARAVTVGGATQLDAGAIHVRGNLTQNGAVNSLTPGATKFVFDGTGPQTIFFSHLLTSWLRDVEIRGPAVDVISNAAVAGQLDVAAGGVITQSAGNMYYTSRVPDEASAGGYRVPTSRMHGSVVMVRNVTLGSTAANVVVSAGFSLTIGEHTLDLAGNFTVDPTNSAVKHVVMTHAAGVVRVHSMTVGGVTQLDAGNIVLRGHFTQNGAVNSMIPTGTAVVFAGTSVQNIFLSHSGSSWLGGVRINPGASVANLTNVLLKGHLDLDGLLHVKVGTFTVQGTLFFSGALRNDSFMTVGACANEGGTFSGTGSNPCP